MTTSNLRYAIRVLFLRDWAWKLLSLFIASALYFTIRSDISYVRTLTIPVEPDVDVSQKADMTFEVIDPRLVRVSLRGSVSLINQLNSDLLKVKIKPRNGAYGGVTNVIQETLSPSMIEGLARGIRVIKMDPEVVMARYDWPITKRFQIAKPVVSGKAYGGVDLRYDTSNVWVKGSQRLLNQLDPKTVQVIPEPINVDGRMQGFTARVKLCPPVDATRVTLDPDEIMVDVRITSKE